MSKIVIGTSGYSYKDWIGPFYPPGTGENGFLEYYTKEFNSTELNFSYYSMPKPDVIAGMINKTPESFLFSIKAHKSMTHEIDPDSNDEAVAAFKKGIEPLREKSRLGAVLFQFPYSFHYQPENRIYLDKICASFAGYPFAVEFRNDEWFRESVFSALAERNAGLVNVDEPDLPKLIRPSDRVAGSPAYIRFHGRNKKDWWSGTNVTRYDYLYTEEELLEWIPIIERIIEAARILIIAFNNHYKGQAVKNAKQLKNMLLQRGIAEVF